MDNEILRVKVFRGGTGLTRNQENKRPIVS